MPGFLQKDRSFPNPAIKTLKTYKQGKVVGLGFEVCFVWLFVLNKNNKKMLTLFYLGRLDSPALSCM